MAYTVKIHTFEDGKVMFEDKIAYANGEYVSLDDYEIAMQKKHDEIVDLRKELRESGTCITQLKHELFNVQKSADEYYNKCIDLTKHVAELESELEVKDNLLKIKNGLCKSPMMTVVVAKTINGQDYVRLEDFISVVNDLQNYDLYHAE